MEKIQIDQLISKRPRVYGSLGFQKFLRSAFVILGFILLVNTGRITIKSVLEYDNINQISKELAQNSNMNETLIRDILVKYLDPLRVDTILYSFFLSLCFFIIARYCQKVINRNRYILQLEEEWKKMSFPNKDPM